MGKKSLNDSQFHMWRTLFAMSHADEVVSNEEIRFMAEALEDIPFSAEQRKILSADIKTPQDIVKMFESISDIADQAKFFRFARDMVYADGDYGKAEQEMLLKLQRVHIKTADVDQLIGKIDLEFESESEKPSGPGKRDKKEIVSSFRKRFLEGL